MWRWFQAWRRKRTHKGLRILRWLGRGLFYPGFFLLLLCAILVSTGPGSHLVTTLASQALPWVTLDYKAGRLNDEIALHYFELDLGFLFIAIDEVRLDWNPWCSLQYKLCVNEVEAKNLVLKLKSSPSKQASEPVEPSRKRRNMQLPFDIEVLQGSVEQGNLRIHDIQIDWQQADVAVFLADGLVDVTKAHMMYGSVHVNAPSQAKPKESKPPTEARAWGETYWPLSHLPDTYLPLQLRVPDVKAQRFDLTIGHFGTDHFADVTVNGQWQQLDFLIQSLELTHLDYGQLSLQAAGQLSHPYPLKLEAQAKPQQLPWFSQLEGSEWQLLLHGDLDTLKIEAQELSEWNWQVNSLAHFSQRYLPFSLDFSGSKMIWPDALETPVQYQNIKAQASGNLLEQEFSLTTDLMAEAQGLAIEARLEAQGEYKEQQLWVEQFEANYLNRQGGLQGQGYLDHRQGLSWQTQLKLDKTQLPQLKLPEPLRISGSFKHKGQYQEQHWSVDFADVSLFGDYQTQPFTLEGDLKFNQAWQGRAQNFKARWGGTQLKLSGEANENWQLFAELTSEELNQWHSELTGPLELALEVQGPHSDPLVHINTQSDKLQYQGIKGLGFLLIGHYRPMRQHEISLDIGLAKAKFEQLEVQELLLNLHGDREAHTLALTSEGDVQANVLWQGQFDQAFSHWAGALVEGEIGSSGSYWQNDISIPVNLTLAPSQFEIAAHCWSSSHQSQICLDQDTQLGVSSDLGISLSLSALDISPYLMPDSYSLTGQLEGGAKASWSEQAPLRLTANLNADQILVNYNNLVDGDIQQTALEHLKLNLDLSPELSSAQLDVATSEQGGIWLDAQIDHNNQQSLSGQLQIHNYQLGRFSNLFPELDTMAGEVSGRLTLAGNLETPQLDGWTQIRGGSLVLLSNPTPIEAFQLDARFEGTQAYLSSDFKLGGGQAQVQGSADWQQELMMDATLKGQRLKVLVPPQSKVELSPDLTFSYTRNAPKLKGTIYVPKGELKLSQLSDEAIALSDDVVFVDDFETAEAKKKTQLETNVQLKLGPKVKLEAFGLSGRLEGSMDLMQEAGTPLQIFGYTSFHDAIFAAYGQRLNIQEKSSLHFNGDPELANLDVRATRFIKSDNVTAGLHLTGNMKKPKITFFSDPAMEQQEVLSYIIRGKGFREEGLDNSMSTAALVGVTALSNLGIGKPLEKLPGISSVSLDTEGEGDETQVTISGYLGERLFLKYGIGVYEPINEVTVRLYLMNQLWLESVTGLEKSLDLYYSFFIE